MPAMSLQDDGASMKLVYTKLAHDKIMQWVHASSFEVSGFGLIEIIDGQPTVTDAFLVEQINSGAETEMDGGAIASLLYETRNHKGDLRVWWHSHVMMQCFISHEDRKTIDRLGAEGWHYHTVFNQKGEHFTCFSCPTGLDFLHKAHFYEGIETVFEKQVDQTLVDFCAAEYKAKVKNKTFTYEAPKQLGLAKGLAPSEYEYQQSFEARWDLKVLVWDLMDTKWSDKEIMDKYGPELKTYGLNIKNLRKDLISINVGVTSGNRN